MDNARASANPEVPRRSIGSAASRALTSTSNELLSRRRPTTAPRGGKFAARVGGEIGEGLLRAGRGIEPGQREPCAAGGTGVEGVVEARRELAGRRQSRIPGLARQRDDADPGEIAQKQHKPRSTEPALAPPGRTAPSAPPPSPDLGVGTTAGRSSWRAVLQD